MKISVVIPAYNEEKLIRNCLQSCIEHAPKNLLEIIVVSNASTDETEQVAREFSGVRVVRELRKGTGYARQKGLDCARGDIVAFLDADTRINSRWFPAMEQEFANDAALVCLSGPCVYYDLPAWKSTLIYMCWMAVAFPAYWLSGFAATGGNFAVKRGSLEDIGGFDTDINFYGDDTNVASRLHAVGTVKFTTHFYNFTSARRFQAQGLLSTSLQYLLNHVSQIIWKTSLTKTYGERPWEQDDNTLHTMKLRDGRVLEFAEYGDLEGDPIFYFHGYIGSCNQAALSDEMGKEQGMRIIAPNRPGIGQSSPKRFTNMTEYADDIEQLATMLDIERFSIFGASAGGSFALACAYCLPKRVRLLGIASCMGPLSSMRNRNAMHWFRRNVLSCFANLPGVTELLLRGIFIVSSLRPKWLYKKMMLTSSVMEIAEFRSEEMNHVFRQDYENIFLQKNGIRGLINEAHLYFHWGFDIENFPKDIPVIVWHGMDDPVIPWPVMRTITHSIASLSTILIPGGHLSFFMQIEDVFVRMKSASEKAQPLSVQFYPPIKPEPLPA